MRILAIRGKNLASLAGEFAVDFTEEPLASAGLFAISGPTGAGKSTLLDALCLALYDDTPRLAKASGRGVNLPDVRGETVTPQDPRNLLRRGTAEAYAEVDFVGNDGRAYRARWAVRRSHGRPGEKLQKTDMSLSNLSDGQRIGGVNKEVLAEIKTRLGLSFEQFTRAVLLAQNEFAAFLKAPDDERASLLETLTGTDRYTHLSRRAFERHKTEKQALEQLENQLQAKQPQPAEIRAAWEREKAEAEAALARLDAAKTEAEGRLRWHESWAALKQEEQRAQTDWERAQALRQAANPRRRTLAEVEAAQDARTSCAGVDRAALVLKESQDRQTQAETQLADAQAKRQKNEDALAAARQGLIDAEQHHADAAAELNRARILDAEIGAMAPGHQQAEAALRDAAQAEADALAQCGATQTEREDTGQRLAATQAWLASHAGLERLATAWPRWNQLLAQAGQNLQEHTQADANLRQADATLAACGQALLDAEQAVGAFHAASQAAETRHQTARLALAAFDADALAQARQTASGRLEALREAEAAWQNLTLKRGEQAQHIDKRQALAETLQASERALAQLAADKPIAAAVLEQAERALNIAEAACGEHVERLRVALESGMPCPVCGAVEHPYRVEKPPLLAGLADEAQRRRGDLRELERQEIERAAQARHARQDLADLAESLKRLALDIEHAAAAWQTWLPLFDGVADAERQDWFAAQRLSAEVGLKQLEADEKALRTAHKAEADAQAAKDKASLALREADTTAQTARAALAQAEAARQAHADRQAAAGRRLDADLAQLDAAFDPGWRGLWQHDPAQFGHLQERLAEQWLAHKEQAQALETQAAILETALASRRQAVANAAAQRQKDAAILRRAAAQLDAKRAERAAVFGGQALDAVEAKFKHAIDAAKTLLQQREADAKAADAAHASAQEALRLAQLDSKARRDAARSAEQSLQQWLADCNAARGFDLDMARLRELLDYDSAWIAAERQALAGWDDAVGAAATVCAERKAKREAHERLWPHPMTADAVQESLARQQAELQQTKDRHTELALNLRHDDECQQASAELRLQHGQQQAVHAVWAQLNELIGSADGKKFRNHAQQLTLDILIGYANKHLADLAKRYRLERVKGSLALLVVDQDMGDEIRSVHSLSGGESFLVSLGLALGLASLSSNRVRVESLFIDEGFGSLDSDTLRVAMEALDSLQAMGRKVGVISHVQEMTERIGTRIQVKRSPGGQGRVVVK